MTGSGFHIKPDDLHSGGSNLQSFGEQVATGGDKLQSLGQKLVSHAKGDHSGVGAVLAKSLGGGTEVAGKVFSEGGRVAGAAGKRLHSNASSHSANEEKQTGVFRGIHDKPAGTDTAPKPGGGAAKPGQGDGGGSGTGGGNAPGANAPKLPKVKDPGQNDPKDTATPGDNRVCKSDPVDVASGEVIMTDRDLHLDGLLPLVLERTHVSSYRAGRWFGPSWASTVDQRLAIGEAGIRYFAPDGMILHYPPLIAGERTLPVEGPRWPLVLDADGTHLLRDTTAARSLHFGGAAENGALRAILDDDGYRIDVVRDQDGAPVELRHSGGYRLGLTVERERITAVRLLGGDRGPEVPITRYGYDEDGRLTEVVNSSGVPMRYDYDAEHRLTGWQDRNGVWYRYVYDQRGRCTQTVGADGFLDGVFAYQDEPRITTHTDSLGAVTTFELDQRGQLLRQTDPLGNTARFEWDRYGRKLSETDQLGRTTRFGHDEDGRLTRVDYADGTHTQASRGAAGLAGTVTAPDGSHWLRVAAGGITVLAGAEGEQVVAGEPVPQVVRDAAGLPVAVPDELGAITRYEYDQFGRPVAVTGPDGGVTRYGWTVEGLLTWRSRPDGSRESWRYDAEGNEIEWVDEAGQVSRLEYAGFDQPVALIDPLGARTEYAYDTELRLSTVTNPQGQSWHYEYDPAGRLARSVDFDGRERRYRYDAAGQVVAAVNAAGETIEYTYDATGDIVATRAGGAVTRFEYDPLGRPRRAADADAELVLERDAAGRVIAESVNGDAVTAEYDPAGRILKRRTPSGAVSEWSYDAAGNPVELRTAGQVLRFQHDGAGQETGRRLATGFRLTRDHGPAGVLTAQTVTGAGPEYRQDFHYRPGGELAGTGNDRTGDQEFVVDAAGRVTGVRAGNWQEQYRYDALGNLTFAGWPAEAAAVVAGGERSYTGTVIESAGQVRYTHDALGRRTTSETADGAVQRFDWDAYDRMIGATAADGSRWRYRYDPLGRRIAKQRLAENGTVVERTEFRWFGELLVEQVHTAVDGGRHVITWDYHPADNRPLTQVERLLPAGSETEVGVRWYSVLTDQIGTPTELFTAGGELAWQRRPTLWGLADKRAGVDIPLRFPGQYHDGETGLHYNFERYYDPETARYLSPDPVGLLAAPNPVAYVHNPLAWTDPLGLTPDCADGTGGGDDPGKGGGDPGKDKTTGKVGRIQKLKDKVNRHNPLSRSGRPSRTQAPSLDDQRHWLNNTGSSTKFKGGSSVHAQLGPSALRYGSKPSNKECTSVNALNKTDADNGRTGRPNWIKGHLLNDNLGGHGTSDNLTPMSQKANATYSDHVETPLKNAVHQSNLFGQFDKSQTHWYGVDFKASVTHGGGANTAQNAIGQHVDVSSHYIMKPKIGGGDAVPVPPGGLPGGRGDWPALPNGRLDPTTGTFTPHDSSGGVPQTAPHASGSGNTDPDPDAITPAPAPAYGSQMDLD